MTDSASVESTIIVVAEEPVYNLLRDSGAGWNAQHRIVTVDQFWADFGNGHLNSQPAAVFFSDQTASPADDLHAAVAAMADYTMTFVVTWNPTQAEAFYGSVLECVAEQRASSDEPATGDPRIAFLATDDASAFLEGVRQWMGDTVAFPAQWAVDTSGAIPFTQEPTPAPVSVAPAPVSVAPAPVAPAPVAVAPAPAPVAPAPVAVAPAPAPVAPAPVAVAPAPVAVAPAPVAPAPVAVAPAPVAPAPVAVAPAPVAVAPAPVAVAPAPVAGAPEVQYGPNGRPYRPNQVTLTVTSSKGGSGKTTTATLTAAAIALGSRKAYEAGLCAEPLKVCLVDMDTRDGQVSSMLGVYRPTALNLRMAPQWDDETVLKSLVKNDTLGLHALLAPIRPRTADDIGPDFYTTIIEILKTHFDVVVLDTSVQYLDPLIRTVCLPTASAIMFVTTLAQTSVHGMTRALREITEPVERGGQGVDRDKIGIVVNQSTSGVGMDRDKVMEAALRVPIIGGIPLATVDVLTATNNNALHHLLTHQKLGPAYHRLAQRVVGDAPLLPLVADPAQPEIQAAPAPATATQATDTRRMLFGRKP